MDQDNSPQNDIRDCRDLTQSQSSDMISQKLDPVHRLPSEIIAKVVSLLGAEDTESLRSLSKHWKDFSEVLNTKQAIVQHFPRYRCPPLGTPVEHNILFRRLVNCQARLRCGFVTKTHRFSEIDNWMIQNRRLKLKRPDKPFSIIDLRSGSEVDTNSIWVSLRPLWKSSNATPLRARLLYLTDAGDYIVGLGAFPELSSLAKITATGTVAWSVSTCWDIYAFGQNNLYTVIVHDKLHQKYHLTVRRLEDGAMISASATHHLPSRCTSLDSLESTLTSNEQILVIKDHTGLYYTAEISTSRMVDIDVAWSYTHPLTTTVVTQPYSSDLIWAFLEQRETKRYEIYSCTLNLANTPTHYSMALTQIVEVGGLWNPCGIDLVNGLIFVQRQSSSGESMEFGVAEFVPKTRESDEKTEKTVIPTEEVRRVGLVIPHENKPEDPPASMSPRPDYSVIIDGYYAYYDGARRTLTVADFWPSW